MHSIYIKAYSERINSEGVPILLAHPLIFQSRLRQTAQRSKTHENTIQNTRKHLLFSKENIILLNKALSIERKEVSLRSEIFVIIPTIIYIIIRWRMQ